MMFLSLLERFCVNSKKQPMYYGDDPLALSKGTLKLEKTLKLEIDTTLITIRGILRNCLNSGLLSWYMVDVVA